MHSSYDRIEGERPRMLVDEMMEAEEKAERTSRSDGNNSSNDVHRRSGLNARG